MGAPQRLDELSQPMQAALRMAGARGIPADNPRAVGVQPATVAALERAGLIAARLTKKSRRREYRPTDRGRGLLAAPAPRFLARGIGYTPQPGSALAVRGPDGAYEPEEGVDEQALAGFKRNAQTREEDRYAARLEQLQRLPLDERLALAVKVAAARRVDVDRELRVVRSRLDAIEKKIWAPVVRTRDAEPNAAQ